MTKAKIIIQTSIGDKAIKLSIFFTPFSYHSKIIKSTVNQILLFY